MVVRRTPGRHRCVTRAWCARGQELPTRRTPFLPPGNPGAARPGRSGGRRLPPGTTRGAGRVRRGRRVLRDLRLPDYRPSVARSTPNRRISLPAFWAGRVRRILPADLVTIAAVVSATLVFAPVTQWGTIGTQALASVFSVQNWVLAAENPPTALQHFWSLGVEEQFYLLWPLLVLAALALCRTAPRGPGRRASGRKDVGPMLLAFFGVVSAASLAYGTD